ncbi:MAG: hypothetical protein P8L18_17140 [Verrucomicrobiota bacterium]|nr:hypothetical protein [Verrucomicrobiota bacterium]
MKSIGYSTDPRFRMLRKTWDNRKTIKGLRRNHQDGGKIPNRGNASGTR